MVLPFPTVSIRSTFDQSVIKYILVPFDAGPSWAGLMPISGKAGETRKLFFWYVIRGSSPETMFSAFKIRFWPTTNASNSNDLLFWTNGMYRDAD